MPANINVVFTNGIGHLHAKLFRNGASLVSGSLNISGTIHFVDVRSDDVISIDGICTGSANLEVDVATSPPTPVVYGEGNFFGGFICL